MTHAPQTPTLPEQACRFACHSGLTCFTKCCANPHLVLTPYDILRLKNRLQVSSEVFLDRYTVAETDGASGLPVVRLKMKHDGMRQCPFVAPDGCKVYADRPGACRLYPLGQAVSRIFEGDRAGAVYFKVKESYCIGWQEEKEWTIQAWLTNQGLDEYNTMNQSFMDVFTGRPLKAFQTLGDRQLKMVFMAAYNLDAFRDFVFKSSFLSRFDIAEDVQAAIRTDDVALMAFACRWLKFALFGERRISVQPPGPVDTPA